MSGPTPTVTAACRHLLARHAARPSRTERPRATVDGMRAVVIDRAGRPGRAAARARCPTRRRAPARCCSTWPRRRSTGPTCMQRPGQLPAAARRLAVPRAGVLRARSPRSASGVTGWQVGDEVCALLAGGGYAEQVAVPAGQLMPVPAGSALRRRRGAARGRLHGLVDGLRHDRPRCSPARGCWCTAAAAASAPWRSSSPTSAGPGSSPPPARRASSTPAASSAPTSRSTTASEDFADGDRAETDGAGVDVILDNMGAAYLPRNVASLAVGGRLVGASACRAARKGELDLGALLAKRATRPRGRRCARGPPEQKAAIVAGDRARRLAADRVDGRSGRSSTGCCRWPTRPRRTGSSRPASTSARWCSTVGQAASRRLDGAAQAPGQGLERRDGPTAARRAEPTQPVADDRAGRPAGAPPAADDVRRRTDVADMVEQPAKVMRIGTHDQAAAGGGAGRAARRGRPQPAARDPPVLDPGAGGGPGPRAARRAGAAHAAVRRRTSRSEAELRIAQAQLVGWLEGLFHGIQTALFAQQMAARAQLEQMRGRALPGQVGAGSQVIAGRADSRSCRGARQHRPVTARWHRHRHAAQYL